MAGKSKKPVRRYTPAERANILAAAAREVLSGPKAAKKFGISQLTFYKWRGPVRGKKAKAGRLARVGKVRVDETAVRKAVRAQIEKLLPQIIREEIEAALR